MGTLLRIILALVVVGAGGLRLRGQQPPPLFRSGAPVLVPLLVTVTDAQRRLVPDLTEDDFTILDNDRPQPIALFRNDVQPITVVVMLDTSGSMTGSLDLLRAAAEQFVIRLLPSDKGRVGAFNDKIEFGSDFTSNRDDMVASLRELDFGNSTRLYDAIALSLDELRSIEGRRVVLVFTDGDDTSSRVGSGDVLDRARTEAVMIYAIGLESNYFNGVRRVRTRPDRILKKLAEETGGGYFELKKADELSATFTRVAQELHSQYILGFVPPVLDGKVHRLAVRMKPAGMSARARKSYVAEAEPTPTAR